MIWTHEGPILHSQYRGCRWRWILKSNRHNISRFSIYVGIFAWLATRNKSRLKSSDIKFRLIAIVECLVLLVCSVTLYLWTAMPQCLFWDCLCTHELTVCINVLCWFWTIKNIKKTVCPIRSQTEDCLPKHKHSSENSFLKKNQDCMHIHVVLLKPLPISICHKIHFNSVVRLSYWC